jgi:hypothetical protein
VDKKELQGIKPLELAVTVEQPSEVIESFNGSVTFRDKAATQHRVTLTKDKARFTNTLAIISR